MQSEELFTRQSLATAIGRPARMTGWEALQGYRSALLNLGRIVLLAAAVLALGRARLSASLETDILIAVVSTLALLSVSRSSGDKRLWLLYIFGFLLFAQLRKLADETGMPVFFDYPIVLDRLLFLGIQPSTWLQDQLYRAGEIGVLDWLLSAVYFSYYFVPHIVAVVIWRRCPGLLPRFVAALLLTFYIGLAASFVAPTAPPWLAAQAGDLAPVTRVFESMIATLNPEAYERGKDVVGANEVAAMPSLHFGITALLAIAGWQFGRVARVLGLGYVLAMGLALVYLGEHYVVDELAGGVTAYAAWRLAAGLTAARGAPTRPSALAMRLVKKGQMAMQASRAAGRS